MVAVATTKGYGETSVGDLLDVSGVSRKAFYEHFDDKLDCFLATAADILAAAMAVTAARLRREGSWEERAERSLNAFLRLVVDQPAAARLCLVESYAAGPRAVALIDRTLADFQAMMGAAFAERPGYSGMPEEMLGGLIGGLRKIIHSRLHRGEERDLLELAQPLLHLGLASRPPPVPLQGKRRRPAANGISANGAGGDPSPAGDEYRRGGDPGERIVQATLEVVAAKGYAAATIGDIATAARVSLTTFYEHFDGKPEAFDAALYASRTRMLGDVLPVYRRGRSWPESIRGLIECSFCHLAMNPAFALLISRDVYAAGPEALDRLDLAIGATQRFVEDGVEDYAPEMPPIWREAIATAVYATLCRRVQSEGAETLPTVAPLATYMVLAPFLGAEAACKVANGGVGITLPGT